MGSESWQEVPGPVGPLVQRVCRTPWRWWGHQEGLELGGRREGQGGPPGAAHCAGCLGRV